MQKIMSTRIDESAEEIVRKSRLAFNQSMHRHHIEKS